MSYKRTIPRDLFNEAKLLKCMGRLALLIHNGELPELEIKLADWSEDSSFHIEQMSSDGSLFISNYHVYMNGNFPIFFTTYNSKDDYPFWVEFCGEDYKVFDEEGNTTKEFLSLIREES